MLSRHRQSAIDGYHAIEQSREALIVRIRRLAAHRGYDRDALVSPMLRRLMPPKRPGADPAAETAELRRRLKERDLDAKTVAYLTDAVEAELDVARLRLT